MVRHLPALPAPTGSRCNKGLFAKKPLAVHAFIAGNFVLQKKQQKKCVALERRVFLATYVATKLLCGIVSLLQNTNYIKYKLYTRHFVRWQVREKGELGRANNATSLLQELEGDI